MNMKPTNGHSHDFPIVFVHLPRTGGITLASIIERQYGAKRAFFVYADPEGDTGGALRELEAMSPSQRRELRALHGHHRFGIHERYFDAASYIALFREPVDRLISYYHYILENPAHYLHRMVVERRMKLRDLVTSRATIELDNHQTRQISGRAGVGIGGCTRQMLDEARENLERRFTTFGLTERFDESVLLMTNAFGWSPPYYEWLNASKERVRRDAVAAEVEELLLETNALDVELYRFAQQKFAATIAAQGPSFDRQLRQLRRRNTLFRPVNRLLRRASDRLLHR
jgi:hypothetical protein